jgi:hypothetical protein
VRIIWREELTARSIPRAPLDVHQLSSLDWSWLIAMSWPVSFVWYGRRSRRGWIAAVGLATLPIAFPLGFVFGRIAAAIMA